MARRDQRVLEIIGNYWDSPGESESVEIEKKILTENGDDIGGMVASFEDPAKGTSKQAALEAHIGRKELQRDEAAIARREMAREAA